MWKNFTTNNFDPELSIPAWNQFLSETLIGVECTSDKARYFDASFQQLNVNDHGLSRIISQPVKGSPIDVALSQRFANDAPEDHLLILLQRKGEVNVSHKGYDIKIAEGSACIIDPTHSYHMQVGESVDQMVLTVKREKVLSLRRGIQSKLLHRTPISFDSDKARFADNMVSTLCESGQRVDGSYAYRVLDLAADMMLDHIGNTLFPEQLTFTGIKRKQLREEVKAYIEGHLCEEWLTPVAISEQFKVTRRYLDSLFADEATTTSKYITQRRISRVAALLRLPEYQHMTISVIAYNVGFNDLSYFNRQFKARFGVSPKNFRHQ
ncbi:helix-turn-helix domain-containing protein [Agarilytica rhodophyticola]|uniref:helix-turn-helix domain-containing protein n=1 Tax=Agarilytica rhodophyticola TaxID=1737490 RepID=UPI000B34635B|nr:helix-turn-helix domain-containing protein [Agarilytica rhodophyticola]